MFFACSIFLYVDCLKWGKNLQYSYIFLRSEGSAVPICDRMLYFCALILSDICILPKSRGICRFFEFPFFVIYVMLAA